MEGDGCAFERVFAQPGPDMTTGVNERHEGDRVREKKKNKKK